MPLTPIAPKKIRFIKLGQGGAWEASCIQDGCIRLGYASGQHQECETGQWHKVKEHWLKQRNGNQGAATRDVNQIRDFYELAPTDVWITLHQRKLYWCRAAPQVIELEDKTRIRQVIAPWRSTDLKGQDLWIENLDGRITQVGGFRGTICDVQQQDYLIQKINAEPSEQAQRAKTALDALAKQIEELIKGLWWHDFELLVELIFSKFGWQRFSIMGAREKDIDLDLRSAAGDRRAVVQIKSHTTQREAEECIRELGAYAQCDEIYFVFHTCKEDLSVLMGQSGVHIWGLKTIARHAINAGLSEWLIHKRS